MCGARREGSCETCDKIADGVLELTVPLISPLIRAADAARIAELEAALAPFADAAKYAHLVPADESSFPDSYPIGGEWIALDVGDLRRAAAVMEPKP
jgi:hypothetical protein